jgi:hypothetical protein
MSEHLELFACNFTLLAFAERSDFPHRDTTLFIEAMHMFRHLSCGDAVLRCTVSSAG